MLSENSKHRREIKATPQKQLTALRGIALKTSADGGSTMKKLLHSKRYICVCLIIFLLCSCGGGNVVPVTRQISFTAAVDYGGERFVCDTSIDKDAVMRLEVSEPESLRGLKFTIDGERVTAEMMGLEYTPDTGKMPFGAVSLRLYGIFSGCAPGGLSENGGNCSFTGRLPDSKYTMIFSPAGLPLSVSLEDGSFSAEFSNVTVG